MTNISSTASLALSDSNVRRGDYGRQIRIEQLHTLHRYLPPILAVNLIVGGAMVIALWGVAPKAALVAWSAALVVVSLIRFGFYEHYRRNADRLGAERHRGYFVAGSALSGLLWGATGVVFFQPEALEFQFFILTILAGLGAGAVSSLTAYMPAFYAYFPASLLPIIVNLFLIGDTIRIALGVMILTYVFALSFFAHNVNRSLVQSLHLRFENIDLVKELSIQKEQAEQANIAKSRFLAAASHDLRQPLHALTLYISLLDEPEQSPRVRRVVGQVNASIQILQNLFNALLDISKLEAGTLVPQREDFRLQPLLDRLANDFGVEAQQKGLTLRITPSDAALQSDPSLLEQVLRNYLSNAVRYTERGTIRVEAQPEGDSLRIEVTDTGIGIPTDQQDAVYREFFQLGNPERDRSKGLGLGLAIVKRVSRLLGHPIGVRSAPGRGSSFSITVPFGTSTSPEAASFDVSAPESMPTAPTLMAVIDDDLSVRESTQALFEHWGCEVAAASSLPALREALEHAGRPPDGIVADYRLRGGHTGLEVVREFHARYGDNIPSLIITGDIAAEPLRELQTRGVQLLHKPVAPAKFRAFLNNVQRRAQKRVGQR